LKQDVGLAKVMADHTVDGLLTTSFTFI